MLLEVIILASYQKTKAEDKSAKKLRLTLAVLYFIQVIMTTFPFMWGETNDGSFEQITAFEMLVHPGIAYTVDAIKLAALGGIFVVFPMIVFFFCVLDKYSNKKHVASFLCCILCVSMIVFGIGPGYIAIGSVVTIILYLLIMFLTSMSVQARNRANY